MKKYLFIVLSVLTISLYSCAKESNDTVAIIHVEDSNGLDAANVVVHAYTNDTWDNFGDDEFFADKTISTDADGNATFMLDDITGLFAFDSQETIYFSTHYTVNGTIFTYNTSLTFQKGQEKKGSLTIE